MPTVETVLGPVAADALGHCQLHEHLFVRQTPAAKMNPALRIDDEEKSALELRDYRAAGGGAILDAQPVGAGRDAAALRRISRESGVAVVTVTGYHRPMFYPAGHWIFTEDEDALSARFLSELTAGVSDGGARLPCRAGAVKAALGPEGPVGRDEALLRAAAKAAAKGNAPLLMHTEAGAGAVKAVALCGRMGLPPSRVLVCHLDRQAEDFRPHEAVAATGAYLEYDTIGRFKYHDDASEILLILHMLERGYQDRLLLSLDTTARRLRRYGGEIALTYLLEEFLPRLERSGAPPPVLRALTRENPARALSGR